MPPHAPPLLIQGAGSALLGSAQSLSELVAVQRNVVSGMAAVAGARALLAQCLEVGALIEGGRLYHALLLLGRIQAGPLGEAGEGSERVRRKEGLGRKEQIPIPGEGWLFFVPFVPFIWEAHSPRCACAFRL